MDELTRDIISAAFEVQNTLGSGFLEKVYHQALIAELRLRNLQAASQVTFPVKYKGRSVGDYFADIVVEKIIVVELKCVDRLSKEHLAQCLNYLKASNLEVCLLINFHRPMLEWKRISRSIGVNRRESAAN